MLLYAYGPIWNRLTRANIFTKGLKYLELGISSTVQNSSGIITSILLIFSSKDLLAKVMRNKEKFCKKY